MMKLTTLATLTAATVVRGADHFGSGGCNPEVLEQLGATQAQHPLGGEATYGAAALHTLPLQGDSGPACLDGTPYGFYFQPSTTGSTKWTVSIDGGGWCYDEQDCLCRAGTSLGTNKVHGPTGGCSCINPNEDGTMVTDCNCIHMPYSDGASFAGFVPGNVSVPGMPGKSIQFRGIKNLDGVIEFALKNGMNKATEFVLTGGSAGGLSTFLHADRFAAALPAGAKAHAAPVVGYFLDHSNFKHTSKGPEGGQPNTPGWSQPGSPTAANYTMWMKYVYKMQGMTFSPDGKTGGGLTKACQAKHPDEPWLCFMSPHMQDVIETPFFMFNSKYDAWQLGNEFQSKWATKEEQAGVLQYGLDFLKQLEPVYTAPETKNGGMITSCICHGCPWPALTLDGKNSFQHYADWFYGKTTGAASMHIDPSLPNGNGTLQGGAFRGCAAFPKTDDFVSML